eukprot:757597-Hanusia_phi.AAC.4
MTPHLDYPNQTSVTSQSDRRADSRPGHGPGRRRSAGLRALAFLAETVQGTQYLSSFNAATGPLKSRRAGPARRAGPGGLSSPGGPGLSLKRRPQLLRRPRRTKNNGSTVGGDFRFQHVGDEKCLDAGVVPRFFQGFLSEQDQEKRHSSLRNEGREDRRSTAGEFKFYTLLDLCHLLASALDSLLVANRRLWAAGTWMKTPSPGGTTLGSDKFRPYPAGENFKISTSDFKYWHTVGPHQDYYLEAPEALRLPA